MPQLDFSTYPSQLFWLLITFLVMYYYMAGAVLPKIARVLQSRSERISNDLDEAAELRDEAESLELEYNASIERTKSNAAEIIAKANHQANDYMEKQFQELEESLSKKFAKNEKKILEAKQQVYQELTEVSSELSREMVQRLTDVKVPKKQADAVVKDIFEAA